MNKRAITTQSKKLKVIYTDESVRVSENVLHFTIKLRTSGLVQEIYALKKSSNDIEIKVINGDGYITNVVNKLLSKDTNHYRGTLSYPKYVVDNYYEYSNDTTRIASVMFEGIVIYDVKSAINKKLKKELENE